MVAIVVFIVTVVDIVCGARPLQLADDRLFAEFSRFHRCMSLIQINPDSCTHSEQCLVRLFGEAGEYLDSKSEFDSKLEVKYNLDNLERDCARLFDSTDNRLYKCQVDGMNVCLNETTHSNDGEICQKLKAFIDCLGPFELDCPNRIFAAILRAISFGIWKSSECSSKGSNLQLETLHMRSSCVPLPVRHPGKRLEDPHKPEAVEYRISELRSRSLVESNYASTNHSISELKRPVPIVIARLINKTNAAITDRHHASLSFLVSTLITCFILRNH